MQYDTIQNRVSGVLPEYNLYCGLNDTWAGAAEVRKDPPETVSRVYTPTVTYSSRTPPGPSGSSWPPRPPEIRITDYSARTLTITNFLVHRPRGSAMWDAPHRTANGQCCVAPTYREARTTWDEVWSVDHPQAFTATAYQGDFEDLPSKIDRLKNAALASAYARANSSQDIGTEIAEAGQTLDLLRSTFENGREILTNYRDINPDLVRRLAQQPFTSWRNAGKHVRKLADAWLQLQFGWMPMVNAVQDAAEEIRRKGATFRSERAFRRLTLKEDDPPDAGSVPVIWHTIDGLIKVSAMVRTHYRSPMFSLYDRVSINPFLTAWEKIPYSFLVDYVIGVGDFIVNHTSDALFSDRKACVSVKTKTRQTVYLVDKTSDTSSRTFPVGPCLPSPVTFDYELKRDINSPLQVRESENYVRRRVFKPPALPAYDPYLNWKRMLNIAALATKPGLRLLKKLLQ